METRRAENSGLSVQQDPRAKAIIEHVRTQRFDLGLSLADAWRKELPQDANAHYWAGYCQMRSARVRAAEQSLRAGIDCEPKHAECQSLLGRSLFAQGRMKEALAAAEAAERLESQNPEVWDAVGVVYGNLGEYKRALQAFRRVEARRPKSARNLFNLASMLNFCDLPDAAERYYRKALSIQPTKFIAYWSLSQLRQQRLESNHIEWLLACHARFKEIPDARLYLSMALAKEYEDIEDYDQSFDWLKRGNEEKRARIDYDPEKDQRQFARIQAAFDQTLGAGEVLGYETREPIFILGLPRTGTTLLEQMLCGHEHVFAAGELQNFLAEMTRMARERVAGMKLSDLFDVARNLDFRELGKRYLDSTRPRTGELPRFIDKMPNNFLLLGAIARALPQAKILHLRRDPMDSCFSNYKQLFGANACPYSYRLEEMARYFGLYQRLMAHWRRTLPGRIYDVDYEALVSNPEGTLRGVFSHLELEWREQALQFHERSRPVGTASSAQIRRPVYASSVGKWRRYERHLQPLLSALREQSITQ